MLKSNRKCQKWQNLRKNVAFMGPFGFFSFSEYIQTLFVTLTQCNKQKICFLQWLSATNKTVLCRSDSLRQTILKKKSYFFVACDKGIGKKTRKKTSFQIWILPPLSNCFGVPSAKIDCNINVAPPLGRETGFSIWSPTLLYDIAKRVQAKIPLPQLW